MDATTETFDTSVVKRSHDLPVVVDFWAEWCGPCKMLGPVLEREAQAREGRLELVEVDVDANQELADRFGIRGIPAVKAFRNGRVVDEFTGVRSPHGVAEFLDKLLAPPPVEQLLAELRESGEDAELVAALEARDYERAFETLLAAAREGDAERREDARRLMVTLFEELGQDDPLATRYRRQLATALY